jgi:ABC-2 type transport system permease protein
MSGDNLIGAPVASGRHPSSIVFRLSLRRAVRSGALWGLIFGVYVALQENAYVSAYPTMASRLRIALALGSNAGTNVLFGPTNELQTVGGFTTWKCVGVFSVLGAVWALLLSTRLLRGEEEAGRWELLLVGQTTRAKATAQAITGSCCGLAVLFAITAAFAVVLGHSTKVDISARASLYFAVTCVAGAVLFLGIGSLASQLAPTRRQAAGYAAGALGVSFVIRMVADTGGNVSWLCWLSPLGWIEELQPLTHPRPLALLPIAMLAIATFWLSAGLARDRDLDASVVVSQGDFRAHTLLLRGTGRLSFRLTRGVLTGWTIAIICMSFILGLVAKSASSALAGSTSVKQYYARLGIHGASASDYLGLALLIVSALVAFAAVGQVTAIRSEESTGRLESLLVRPISRWRWLGGRVGIASAALVGFGLCTGLTSWVGASSQGANVGFVSIVQGGLNIVPPGLCLLGIGVLAFGLLPRATTSVAYGVLGWSFLIAVIGGAINLNHWLLDTSVLHQMAAAPAVNPDWISAGAMVVLGAVAALAGGISFSRRDLVGD